MAHFGIPKRAELISYGSIDLKATLMSRARKNYSFEPYLTLRTWIVSDQPELAPCHSKKYMFS
ncbi:hypothetical protein ALP31_200140 [Pseudomonas amygdali pv. morsprunorum]|nr:hypothetical protein ALP31_200140 [Pseudomonas amygdali pv. morsprunorum]